MTTVTTTDGSVWEGEARLIEEASIGSAGGSEEYLLLQPAGLSADLERRRIAVADYRVPIVRIFDFEGNHLFDVGGKGDGPGEYRYISGVYLNEADGRILVHLYMDHWVNIYAADGTYLDRWGYNAPRGQGSMGFMPGSDGLLHIEHDTYELQTRTLVQRMITYTVDGTVVDTLVIPEFEQESAQVSGLAGGSRVPFSPFTTWNLTTAGDLIWGFTDDYRFHICADTGAELVVEKYRERVPVLPEEAAWQRESITRWLRSGEPSWQWNGPPIPDHKPAYSSFFADLNDRIWVHSEGPSIRRSDMIAATDEEIRSSRFSPWRPTHRLDVFDCDGHYLGPVAFIDEGFPSFGIRYARDDVVLAQVSDEDGVPSIRRYRLVLP